MQDPILDLTWEKKCAFEPLHGEGLQIIHVRDRDHWCLLSNFGNVPIIFESLFLDVSPHVEFCLRKLLRFYPGPVRVQRPQKQIGGVDCGLFAIAFAFHLALGLPLGPFNQSLMRKHLLHCFRLERVLPFPLL